MIIRAVDLETTGLEPSDEVVEIGYCDVLDDRSGLATAGITASLVRPSRKIPAVASAVHHITDHDVRNAKPWADAWRVLLETADDGTELTFVAHNNSFERQFLDPLIKAQWIDTWRCALRQWPDLESHSLQAIRYALSLPADPGFATPPHRAPADAYLCGLLLLELLKHQTVETLVAWSAEPAIFTKFDFGKFNGQPLSAADDGFLNWMLGKDFSEDWKWNVRRELQRRANTAVEAVAAERRAYLDRALTALPGAACVRDLQNWYQGSADDFAKHGILVGSDEYDLLIKACADRKKVLLESGEPQFDGAPA